MVWTICIEDTIKHAGSTSTSVPGGRRWVAEDQQDNVSRSPNTNGNVDSGRLTSLGGDWCMHMLVTVPENSEQDFRKLAQNAISEFGDWDLTIRKNTMRQAVSHQRRRLVKLSGEDKPGIMHAASAFFAQLNINILSMSVHIEPAPFTSSPLFKLEALIQVPDELTDEKLEEGLEDVGEKEEVDMWIETGEAPEFLPETA
jgi:glycine cleavage system regulatory protein